MNRGVQHRGAVAALAALALVGAAPDPAAAEWGGWLVDAPSRARQDYEVYAVAEALAMQRNTDIVPSTLAIDGDTLQPVLGTGDLEFAVAPGVRLLYGRHGPGGVGWEVGYVGVYGMTANAEAVGANLDITPPLSNFVDGLRGATAADASWNSSFNSIETNLLWTHRHVHHPRHSGYHLEHIGCVTTWDWLAGFRWAGLAEDASVTMLRPADDLAGDYAVRTMSNLFGAQLGGRLRVDWEAWSLEAWGKAALAGAAIEQTQAPIVDPVSGDVFRTERSSSGGDVGGIFDVGVALAYPLDDVWSIRAGFTSLWVTGVALAPNQFDFSAATGAGTELRDGDGVWLGGASLGLEARY